MHGQGLGLPGARGGRQHPGGTDRELSPRTGSFGWRPHPASPHSSLARGDGQVAPSECQHRAKATEGQGP